VRKRGRGASIRIINAGNGIRFQSALIRGQAFDVTRNYLSLKARGAELRRAERGRASARLARTTTRRRGVPGSLSFLSYSLCVTIERTCPSVNVTITQRSALVRSPRGSLDLSLSLSLFLLPSRIPLTIPFPLLAFTLSSVQLLSTFVSPSIHRALAVIIER